MFHIGWQRLLRAVFILCVFTFVSLTFAADKSQVDPAQVNPDSSQLAATATAADLEQRQRLLTEAYAIFHDEQYLEAVEAFTEVIDAAPDWAEGYIGRGIAHGYAELYEESLDDFDRAIALGSDDPYVHLWRGSSYWALSEEDAAIDAINRAITLNPRYVISYQFRGTRYFYMRRFEEVIADYDRVLIFNPNNKSIFDSRYLAYNSLTLYDESNLDKDIAFGLHAQENDSIDAAVIYFTRAIDRAITLDEPRTLSYAYLYRAEAHRRLQNETDAQADLEAALIANPALGDAYIMLGDYDSAVRAEPDNPLMYWLRAEHQMAQDQFEAAAADLLAHINLNSSHRVHVEGLPSTDTLPGYEIGIGWSYWFSFDAQPGQQISVSAIDRDMTDADPVLLIVDSDGHPLIARLHDLSNIVLERGGRYTLVMAPSGVYFDRATFTLSITLGSVLSAPQQTGTASRWTATPTMTPTPSATLTPTATSTIDRAMGRFIRFGTLRNLYIGSASWSPDGANLYTYSPINGLSKYPVSSLSTPHMLSRYDEFAASGLSVSPDGRLIAYGPSDILMRDASTGELLRTWRGHSEYVKFLEFSPDGRLLFSADSGDQYLLWDVATGTQLDVPRNLPDAPHSAKFSPDGTKIVLVNIIGKTYLLDVIDGTKLQLANNGNELNRKVFLASTTESDQIAFSPDGTLLAMAGENNTAVLWDVNSGQVVNTLRGHDDDVTSVDFSPDGLVLATGSKDRAVKLWHVPTGEELATLDAEVTVNSVIFNPVRMLLAIVTGNDEVQFWGLNNALDLATATPPPTISPLELTATVAALTATPTPTATLTSSGYLERGDTAFAARDYLTALADFDLAIAVDDENITAHVSRGHTLGELNRWGDAIAAYTRALELDEDNPDLYAYIARAYESIQGDENTEVGIDYANRALAIDPDNVVALTHRARGYYRLGDNDTALADLNRAIELAPDYSEAYIIRGVVYGRGLELRDLAFADFETALEIDPYDERTYRYRGLVYYDFDNSDDALANLNRSIELDPNYVEAHTDRGRVHLYLTEDYEKAVADFLQALELSPDDIFALANLGLTYIRQSQYGLAVDVLEKAVLVDPDNAGALINLGEAYYFLDQPQKALDAYWRGVAALPSDAAPVPTFILNRIRELEIRLNVTATPTSTPQENTED